MPENTVLLDRVRALVPTMTGRAEALDETASFPAGDVADLVRAGVLVAPMPVEHGGHGIATEPATAADTLALLALLGRGNLAVGRVVEAHFNALRLVVTAGAPDLLRHVAADAAAGHLFALWVTDSPAGPLRLHGARLLGDKQFCSAAGHATRAVVTAIATDDTVRLAMVELDHVTTTPLAQGMQGMRAATTGQARFSDTPAWAFGEAGDYLREPDFSCGAWRTSAVTLGGLQALVSEAVQQIKARGRGGDPHQQARMGHALMAQETALLWMQRAAVRAESAADDPRDAIAYVNFARLAVERACLEAMTLVQRSLGVAAFLRPNPVERLCRDLGTYLRQPAGDSVLTEAAAYGMGL